MWFKNITLFNLTHPFRVSAESLEVIDNLREENDDIDAEALFLADTILFRGEVTGLLKQLMEIFKEKKS